ncbi:MAG: sigma-70 family RNA polymerase sigma factor [Pirellulaceae bacterium]|nr:sigma-70 family RNA polymerase sigma factor [Pirellulaceae bacterium]
MADEFSQLLTRARGGDRDALTRIAEQYEAKLRVVARVHLGPALRPYLDSQDLVQSVHRSIMVGLRDEKFDISTPEKLVALTLTMLRRKIARHWRRMRRQERLANGSNDLGDIVELLASLSTPPESVEAEAQFRDSIMHLCSHMDALERQIIDLRLLGFAAPEIALQVGLSSVNVRVRMTRLRQRLAAAGVLDDWL